MTEQEMLAKIEAAKKEAEEKYKKQLEEEKKRIKESDVIKEVTKDYEKEIAKIKEDNEKEKKELNKKIEDLRAEHILQIRNMMLGRRQKDEYNDGDDDSTEEQKYIDNVIKQINERY